MSFFLTGGTRVGKSTVVRSFLQRAGLSADGFMTYWQASPDGSRSLYLSPYSLDGVPTEKRLLARRWDAGLKRVDDLTSVFDTYGVDILQGCGTCDVIVMDELGFLESQATAFQAAVLQRIAGDTPVVGVMRSAKTDFLNVLRSHPAIEVREVTPKNRDAVADWLASQKWK